MRLPDDKYVAKLRRTIAWWDRWRYWMILLHVILLACVSWMTVRLSQTLLELAEPEDVPFTIVGLLLGAVVGFSFGWMFYGLLQGLVTAISGFRSERLLLQYYDSANAQSTEDNDPRECKNEPDETNDRYIVR